MSDAPSPAALGVRVADWYAGTALLRAGTVTVLVEGAWAVRTPRWPGSFASNALVVRRDVGGERLVAWAEEHLDGLAHRYVSACCDLSPQTRTALEAAGYRLTPLVTMSLAVRPSPGTGDSHRTSGIRPGARVAERVGLAESERLHRVLWNEEWLPGIGEAEVDQLVGRRLEDRGGELLSWVVRDPAADHPVSGDLVACADLCVRGWAAEVDAVATLAAFRGRGYADTLMEAAATAAGDLGCTHVVLSALADDWPRRWYGRLGFAEVGVAWEALRRDDGLAFDDRRDA